MLSWRCHRASLWFFFAVPRSELQAEILWRFWTFQFFKQKYPFMVQEIFIRKRWPCAIWKAEVATGCEELPSVVLSVDRAAPIPLESELCIRCCTTFCCFCMLLLLQRIYLGLKSIWVCLQFQPSWYASPFCVVGAVRFKYTNRTRSIVCVCVCVCVFER